MEINLGHDLPFLQHTYLYLQSVRGCIIAHATLSRITTSFIMFLLTPQGVITEVELFCKLHVH